MEAVNTISEKDLRRYRVNFGMRLGAFLIDSLVMGVVAQVIIAPIIMVMMEDIMNDMTLSSMHMTRHQPTNPGEVLSMIGNTQPANT